MADYADPASEKLKVILKLNDFSVAQVNVKLRFEIKGNGFTLSTKTFYNPGAVTLIPGQPFLLSGAELAPYLNSSNLDFMGINQGQYEQQKVLPEGYYSICVTAFDYYNSTPVQLSNEACSQAWFTLSDPPYLNMPLCNSVLTPLYPQNIVFQWAAMNLGSPNSALNTEYDFALWESRPDSNAIPNQVVLSTAPIFSTSTQQTFFNYGITEPALNLYMKYVWRVRAKDISGRDLFKNQGYSQICTFKYGSIENVVNGLDLTLTAEALSHRMGRCDWNKQSVFTGYLLQVRKTGTAEWFEYNNSSGTERIMNLEPSTQYEARVRGDGNGITGAWSNTVAFTTQQAPNYSCNNQAMPTNNNLLKPLPLEKAVKGLIIQSGQFEVHVTQIFPGTSEGWYGGKGYVSMMGVKKVPVKWSHIYIDDIGVQHQGIIEAETKGIDTWVHQWDMAQAEDNATYVDGTLDTVFINGNQLCYVMQGSNNTICVPTPTGVNIMIIRDGEGNEYDVSLVPPPPKITGPTNYLHYSADSLMASDNKIVHFEMSPGQVFGFDGKQYAGFISNYEAIKLRNGKNYFVANKAIGTGSTDQVVAKVTVQDFNSALLKFKTEQGEELSFSVQPKNKFLISSISHSAGCIYAWYNNEKIGKLNIISLKAIAKKVVIVPVNNSNTSITSEDLNQIFKQANVSWSVTTAPNFTFDLVDGKMESPETTILNKYSDEMKLLRNSYREKDTTYDKEALYILVVPQFNDGNQLGYMAKGKALGFISSAADVKSVAHELGHGAFAYKHTFPLVEKGKTYNLMDYGSGSMLILEQWQKAQKKPENFNWFDDEDDGSMFGSDRSAETAFTILTAIKLAYKKGTTLTVPQGNKKCNTGAICRELIGKATNCYVGGVQYDFIEIYIDPYKLPRTASPRNRIAIGTYDPGHGGAIKNEIVVDDHQIMVRVPQGRIDNMRLFLRDTFMYKNLMVFCNGYRPIVNFNDGQLVNSSMEYANTNNACENGDCRGYWKGIDQQFMNRVGNKYAVYFDGHHSVGTSNHKSVANYMAGNILSDYIRNSASLNTELANLTKLNHGDNFLHTNPNVEGFNERATSGEQGARNLMTRINNGSVIFNKNTDVIDVVAHSMGYAYSVGLVRELKKNGFKFGRYYILAPENACSGGVNLNWFEEAWQYGSNLGEPNEDLPWLQDGVAPQCAVTGIDNIIAPTTGGRVFIPNVDTKSYLGSHSVSNYGWIFTTRKLGMDGYVKPR
ncbi:MAG: fibronectin type III domain-containing protein [Bacteroidetes bacterium]|nr:fibronectin type III domain-containing protein [Bacteroidota bacterium]